MKCPICGIEIKTISAGEIKCTHCGFDDIRIEFINEEERIFWLAYVVKPCKYAYNLNQQTQKEVEMLRKEIKKPASDGIADKSRAIAPSLAQNQRLKGWNYDDPIAHPNSATGVGRPVYNISFTISEIKSQMTSASTATITFSVKKISDKDGMTSKTPFWIRYRVKNKAGVILLNETKFIKSLQIGDVVHETIKLTGVTAGEHTIDFVSYEQQELKNDRIMSVT